MEENIPDKNPNWTSHETFKYLSKRELYLLKQSFSNDLYEELCKKQNLTEEDMTIRKNLLPLAQELAASSKYKDYLSDMKFSQSWMCQFRKKYYHELTSLSYTLEAKREVSKKAEKPKPKTKRTEWSTFSDPGLRRAEEIRETFSQDLHEEVSRRQNQTGEYVTNEKVRTLAKELAVDPKYEGYLSSYKFGYDWITHFRNKFDMRDLYKKRFTLDEKVQISVFIDNNPGLTNVEVGRQCSTLLGRKVAPEFVRKVKLNREKWEKLV